MTTKTITGAYPAGYALSTAFSGLYIGSTATVNGPGVIASAAASIVNAGSVVAQSGSTGVSLDAGGSVYNVALISGYDGVDAANAAATVTNKGMITAKNVAVTLSAGGRVVNDSTIYGDNSGVVILVSAGSVFNYGTITSAATDSATGIFLAAGGLAVNRGMIMDDFGVIAPVMATIFNYGTIDFLSGAGQSGVALVEGGAFTNGSLSDTNALIEAHNALEVDNGSPKASAVVRNFATIFGGPKLDQPGAYLGGVVTLTNGAPTDKVAVIQGYDGVRAPQGVNTITNFGSLVGTGAGTKSAGVYIQSGVFTNGSTADTASLVTGISGVRMSGAGIVTNYGFIDGTTAKLGAYGVLLGGGGRLVNGSASSPTALIEGNVGVYIKTSFGTVINFGSIETLFSSTGAGVALQEGGRVVNGSAKTHDALIQGETALGVTGAAGTVTNYGTIEALGGSVPVGVSFNSGGLVTNGSAADRYALISGRDGVFFQSFANLVNFGTVNGTGTYGIGVAFEGGGTLTNEAGALIEGTEIGVLQASTLDNFGTVKNTGTTDAAVYATSAAGVVTNGANNDVKALIEGSTAVNLSDGGTVFNFGVIIGTSQDGVVLEIGSVTNGSGADAVATIYGYATGVLVTLAPGTVTNFGSISSTVGAGHYGVSLEAGGTVVNGSAKNTTAEIQAGNGIAVVGTGKVVNFGIIRGETYDGVSLGQGSLANGSAADTAAAIHGYSAGVLVQVGPGTVTNFGTISAATGAGYYGVSLQKGGALTNGSASDAKALVEGAGGVALVGTGVVTNFGTIKGSGGTAVNFTSSSDVLVVEAGSSFVGKVLGGGGRLDLANGVGTLTGLLTGGNVTVSGSMAMTAFTDFATVDVEAGARFTLAGKSSIASGQELIDGGSLSAGALLSVAGTLVASGTLTGSGELALTAGPAAFDAGASLSIAKVAQSGSSAVVVAAPSLAYAGAWTQTAGALTVASGDKITFTGGGDVFDGTLAGAGAVAFTGGSDSLNGAVLTAASVVIDGPTVTLAGSITLAHALSATTASLIIAGPGATLAGGGSVVLSDTASNRVVGATSTATLTNLDDHIFGAGGLGAGSMSLINDTAGAIDGDDSLALTIDTGARTIINAGVIEATGAGGLTIKSAIASSGVLAAAGGNLTVLAAVTAAGTVKIDAGAADFAGAFSQNVDFTGPMGVLELAHSTAYGGKVSGFSKTGGTSFDLEDIAFGAKTKASYSGTTTSGTLTVTDGTHTAKITLEGNYLSSTFKVSKDAGGGTIVVDPTAPASAIHPFIAAAAGFGARRAGAVAATAEAWRPPPPILTAPPLQLV